MNSRQTSNFFLIAILFVIVMLCSCKTDPSSTDGTVTADEKFTVVSHLDSEPDMLNPCLSTRSYSRQVHNHIFSHLVHYDTKTLEISPMLAKELPKVGEITEGEHKGLLLSTYEIHEEAVWDDGTPVTGHDVEFSIKAILNPKVPADAYRGVAVQFKDMKIDETNPKKFTLVSDNYFLVKYIFTDIPTIPAHIYDPKGLLKGFTIKQLSNTEEANKLAETDTKLQEFATEFTSEKYSRDKAFVKGCGPYELEEWITGQRIVLKKKKDWWGTKLASKYPLLQASPETIIYRPIKDPTTATTELKSGSIDIMGTIPSKQYADLKESEQGRALLNFHEPLAMAVYYIGMNGDSPKLSDKKVRRAIAHMVDIDEIIKTIMFGYAKRTASPFHLSRDYYNKDLALIDYNLDKASALLKEAGWEDSNGNGIVDKVIDGELIELKLDYLTTPKRLGEKIGILIQPLAKQIGIEINFVIKDHGVLMDNVKKRNYELTTGGWGIDPSMDDPYQNWHTDSDTPSGGNRFGFGNDESDKIIEEIRSRDISQERRTELYKKIQKMIYDEQPCVFLMIPSGRVAINKKFDYTPSVRKPIIFENQVKLKR